MVDHSAAMWSEQQSRMHRQDTNLTELNTQLPVVPAYDSIIHINQSVNHFLVRPMNASNAPFPVGGIHQSGRYPPIVLKMRYKQGLHFRLPSVFDSNALGLPRFTSQYCAFSNLSFTSSVAASWPSNFSSLIPIVRYSTHAHPPHIVLLLF